MNKCDCENQNCKHNVYIQPPRGVSQQKRITYIHSNVPMQNESEQKLAYKNCSSQSYIPIIKKSAKASCLRNSLNYGSQYPFESTHYSSYKKWVTPNELVIVKPKNCVDLLGSGPMEFITTQKIEFQRKNSIEQSKKYRYYSTKYQVYLLT